MSPNILFHQGFSYPVFYFAVKDYPSYVETLPPSARPHLELQLDWGHGDVEKDLSEIANHMLDWEEKLATHLELTPIDIHDIKEANFSKPILQRLGIKM